MNRFIALLKNPASLRGICPSCEGVMDETGCRIGEHFISREPRRTRGIAQVVEVFCAGEPIAPVQACPACP